VTTGSSAPTPATEASTLAAVETIAARFAADRRARQRRTHMDSQDFAGLAAAGLPLSGVPRERGGLWESAPASVRPIAQLLRTLAHGDSSVALVSAMHPSVLAYWLTSPDVTPEHQPAWDAQRKWVAQSVLDGAWWGTITSEPGSGGDVLRTRATARPSDPASGHEDIPGRHYRLSGEKHFGSGSGISSYMLTTAIPDGETEPDWFFLITRDTPADGSAGMTLTAPWDGHGMTATQSHGMRFQDFPAVRLAAPGMLATIQSRAGAAIGCWFTAVITGIVDVAVQTAAASLSPRKDSIGPFEQVEWARARTEAWLIEQAFEGMLRAVEAAPQPDDPAARLAVLQGKTAIAELAETVLTRLCRVIGGGTFARYSPFGFWHQDVRALGFLRPPWSLAFDRLIDAG
jgi:alkylation response protein AidB-like acyl-CoA dehydrogenase